MCWADLAGRVVKRAELISSNMSVTIVFVILHIASNLTLTAVISSERRIKHQISSAIDAIVLQDLAIANQSNAETVWPFNRGSDNIANSAKALMDISDGRRSDQ